MLKKRIKISLMGLVVFAIILSSVSIAFAASAPQINSFTTSTTNIKSGSSATLKWNTSNAKSVEIIGLEKLPEENLPLIGELTVKPTRSTTYCLNAYGYDGSMVSATVDVSVDASSESAQIISFTSTATQVKSGESATLKWKVKNAKSVEVITVEKISEEVKEIPAIEGEQVVSPVNTTTYVLQVVGYSGETISKSLTITVTSGSNPVSVDSFTANQAAITLGDTVTLSWKASNAAKVNISGVSGDLSASGTTTVKPTSAGTATYTLTATGQNGDKATATVNITVNAASTLKITGFSASSYQISKGSMVKLSWSTENATSVVITTNDGAKMLNRPVNGYISVTPNTTRTYTLTAYDSNKNKVEKSIQIVVN